MIIGFPHRPGSGGPGSFQRRFEKKLIENGFKVVYKDDNIPPDLCFIIGGTKKLGWLLHLKKNNIPIIHRLDGLVWLHRKSFTGIKDLLRKEISRILIKTLHGYYADYIVYQSFFVAKWWDKVGFKKNKKYDIIYNGVDIDTFKPNKNSTGEGIDLLAIEGNIDYSPFAIDLLNFLQLELVQNGHFNSLIVYGEFAYKNNRDRLNADIIFKGKINRDDVQQAYKSSIYLSLDVNAACPNTVIEALSSGIPVVGFDTGALKELVPDNCGKVVPYGGNPWKLDKPKFDNIASGCLKVLKNWEQFSNNARIHAENKFDISTIFNQYIEVINKMNKK